MHSIIEGLNSVIYGEHCRQATEARNTYIGLQLLVCMHALRAYNISHFLQWHPRVTVHVNFLPVFFIA